MKSNLSEEPSVRQIIGNIGFSARPVLPGEDQAEFAKLGVALFRELGVQGELEEDAFRTLLAAIWRKQNLSIFKLAAKSRALYGLFRFPNDGDGFRKYMVLQFQTLLKVTESQKERYEQSQQNPPQMPSPGGDTQVDTPILIADESIVRFANDTLRKVLKIQLGSKCEEESKKPQNGFSCGDPRIFLAMEGELITPECLIAELEMNERLDDAIDRSYDRLKRFQAERNNRSTPPSISPLLQHMRLLRRR